MKKLLIVLVLAALLVMPMALAKKHGPFKEIKDWLADHDSRIDALEAENAAQAAAIVDLDTRIDALESSPGTGGEETPPGEPSEDSPPGDTEA
jgi:peptidoglycan hydrolase CwlO-like protein